MLGVPYPRVTCQASSSRCPAGHEAERLGGDEPDSASRNLNEVDGVGIPACRWPDLLEKESRTATTRHEVGPWLYRAPGMYSYNRVEDALPFSGGSWKHPWGTLRYTRPRESDLVLYLSPTRKTRPSKDSEASSWSTGQRAHVSNHDGSSCDFAEGDHPGHTDSSAPTLLRREPMHGRSSRAQLRPAAIRHEVRPWSRRTCRRLRAMHPRPPDASSEDISPPETLRASACFFLAPVAAACGRDHPPGDRCQLHVGHGCRAAGHRRGEPRYPPPYARGLDHGHRRWQRVIEGSRRGEPKLLRLRAAPSKHAPRRCSPVVNHQHRSLRGVAGLGRAASSSRARKRDDSTEDPAARGEWLRSYP